MQAEETLKQRGRLKIFFGMAPGVGKTYAMLEAARKVAAVLASTEHASYKSV